MTRTILDIKEWYSIDNVCKKLCCNLADVKELIEQKKLSVYGRLDNELLLAYKNLRSDGAFYYGGKAQVRYSGLVKLNRFTSTRFMKSKQLTTRSVSITSIEGLNVISEDDIYDAWIYDTHLNKWKYINESETYFDFEYCMFPKRRASIAKKIADVSEKILSGLDNKSDFEYCLEAHRKEFNQYDILTHLTFDESSIVFNAKEVAGALGVSDQKVELTHDYKWYNSFKRKNPLKKIVDILVCNYPSNTARELWDNLRKDSEAEMNFDPDCLIEEIGFDTIYLSGTNTTGFKTFTNYVSQCRNYYRVK